MRKQITSQSGLELPDIEDDPDGALPPSLSDLDDDDHERKPRDWRQE